MCPERSSQVREARKLLQSVKMAQKSVALALVLALLCCSLFSLAESASVGHERWTRGAASENETASDSEVNPESRDSQSPLLSPPVLPVIFPACRRTPSCCISLASELAGRANGRWATAEVLATGRRNSGIFRSENNVVCHIIVC